MKSYLLILTIYIFPAFMIAQANEEINNLPGANSGQFRQSKDNTIYFFEQSCKESRLYVSVDDGNIWKRIKIPKFQFWNSYDVSIDGTIYIQSGNSFYYSINKGVNWIEQILPFNEIVKHVSGFQNGIVFITSGGKTYKSIDYGKNWNKVLDLRTSSAFKLYYEKRTDRLIMCSSNELFYSKNQGDQWIKILEDNFSSGFYPTIIAGKNNKIYISGIGRIWILDSDGKFIKSRTVSYNGSNGTNICQTSTGRLWLSLYFGNLYSDDEGVNWKFTNRLHEVGYDRMLLLNSGSLLSCRYSGGSVYRSNDHGNNWSFSSYGIQASSSTDVVVINDESFAVASPDGLFLTTNNGKKFENLIEGFLYPNEYEYRHRISLIQNNLFFSDYYGLHKYNLDTKITTLVKSLNEMYDIYNIVGGPSSNELYIYDNSKIYVSSDLGKSWNNVAMPFPINELRFILADNKKLIAANFSQIYRSEDKGTNWTLSSENNPGIIELNSNSKESIYYVSGSATPRSNIFFSTDFGLTWVLKEINFENTNGQRLGDIVCNNLNEIFLIDKWNDVMLRSIDLGKSFYVYQKYSQQPDGVKLIMGNDYRIYTIDYCDLSRSNPTSEANLYQGTLYQDTNVDCINDINDPFSSGTLLKINDGKNSRYSISNLEGKFNIPYSNRNLNISGVNLSTYKKLCNSAINISDINNLKPAEIGIQEIKKCPELKVEFHALPRLRRCFNNTIYLSYRNFGTDIATNAYIEVTLDPYFKFISASIKPSKINANILTFELGDLPINSSGKIEIIFEITCNSRLGQFHCVEAIGYPNQDCDIIPPAKVRTSAICNGDSIQLSIKNLSSTSMSTNKTWKLIEYDDNSVNPLSSGIFRLNGNESLNIKYPSKINKLLFIADQADNNLYNLISQTHINSCTHSNSEIINFDEDEPFISKECGVNLGSFDPNDIVGTPTGITSSKRIEKEQELEYTIRFQNTGTDTAFNINIINYLENSNLDLSTLQFGISSHPYTVSIIDGQNLAFSFKNIMLPDSNINSLLSNGFLKYSIRPKNDLIRDDQIQNKASIYFDFNDPVETNNETHTIGLPIITQLDINDQSKKQEFVLFPNPSNHYIKILTHNSKLQNRLLNIIIRDINNKPAFSKNNYSLEDAIDISSIPSGIYKFEIITDDHRMLVDYFIKI